MAFEASDGRICLPAGSRSTGQNASSAVRIRENRDDPERAGDNRQRSRRQRTTKVGLDQSLAQAAGADGTRGTDPGDGPVDPRTISEATPDEQHSPRRPTPA